MSVHMSAYLWENASWSACAAGFGDCNCTLKYTVTVQTVRPLKYVGRLRARETNVYASVSINALGKM